jgi:RIO-like serine/threonine protein kinase
MSCAAIHLQRSDERFRDAFLAGLESIHKAGVYHGDLRYENLVIDSSGDVAIIDFDQAIIDGKESDKKSEYRKLRRLLEARVDTSIRDEPEPEGSREPRTRKERNRDEGAIVGRVTRSMGTSRETLGGMRLRPGR